MKYYTQKEAEKCCTGCNIFFGGEIRHIKECVFYPESLTEIYDRKDEENAKLKEELTKLREALDIKKSSHQEEHYINQHMIPKKEAKMPRYFFVCFEVLSQGIPSKGPITKGHITTRANDGLFNPQCIINEIKNFFNKGSENVILTSVFEITKEEAGFENE